MRGILYRGREVLLPSVFVTCPVSAFCVRHSPRFCVLRLPLPSLLRCVPTSLAPLLCSAFATCPASALCSQLAQQLLHSLFATVCVLYSLISLLLRSVFSARSATSAFSIRYSAFCVRQLSTSAFCIRSCLDFCVLCSSFTTLALL